MRSLLQFTLDLFDTAPAPLVPVSTSLAQVPGGRNSSESGEKSTQSGVERPYSALNSLPSEGPPAEALDRLMTPASFGHPRANREVALAGTRVAYEFRRGKRRTIGFSIGPDGLAVRAPNWVPLYEVDAALRDKADWIIRKLGEARQRQGRMESARIEWCDGATFPFFGDSVRLVLDPRHGFKGTGAQLVTTEAGPTGESGRTLQVGLPHSATPQQIRDAAQAWLMRQAHRCFIERLDHFAPRLGVRWKKLSLSNAGTRWGSASADGSIRLNWRLVHFRMPVIDYVVAHELSHLRVMDHSPRFWDTVESVMPDYGTLRVELKRQPVPNW
jgi:hypothetical protein